VRTSSCSSTNSTYTGVGEAAAACSKHEQRFDQRRWVAVAAAAMQSGVFWTLMLPTHATSQPVVQWVPRRALHARLRMQGRVSLLAVMLMCCCVYSTCACDLQAELRRPHAQVLQKQQHSAEQQLRQSYPGCSWERATLRCYRLWLWLLLWFNSAALAQQYSYPGRVFKHSVHQL
jgi:hypothetical protein